MYRHYLNLFIQSVGPLSLTEITPEVVDWYLSQRRHKVSRTSLWIETRTLKAAFSLAVRWEWIPRNPFRFCKPPTEKKLPVFLSLADFWRIHRTIPDQWLKDLIVAAAFSGMRLSELWHFTWDRENIYLRSTEHFRLKWNRERIIPSHPLLTELLDKRGPSWRAFTPGYSSKRFHHFAHVKFHALRHTFASWLVERGIPLKEIQELMGHSSIVVTEIYAHVQQDQLRSAINRL